MAPLRLKEFVRVVRSCKTAAEERDVIAKESAAIRTAFKDADNEYRHRSVAKLLYIHMLGYNAQFGQVECVKLCASPRFADKRLGYLGIMLLLDENQEVLTLVTNSLKNDMNHPNVFVNGLACCTLGNISSAEMARDLAGEVEKLIGSQSSYVRKKACLCAVRIMRKVPELHENFISRALNMLSERNHAVLLTGVTLINEILKINPEIVGQFRRFVPDLVRLMKALSTSTNSSEHDVGGIADPFLQVNILRLMCTLGKGDAHASELMSDTLARVATNTDGSKNVGNSILYETVLTIMEIESEAGLRVFAINILGRFLANRDNNIRYVALNTLLRTLSKDNNAVQRHRNTVVECLQDGDISIRRRALELTFALINDSNIRVLVRELLTFLEKADKEFKTRITSEIAAAADRDAPNKRWHVDTILRVLRLAGNHVEDDILANFIRLISTSPELHAYTVNKLYHAIKEDVSQEALMHAGVWAIGEYGDVLVKGEGLDPEEAHVKISESDVIDLLESVLKSPYTSMTTREYVLTALMKLSTRFATGIDRIQSLLRAMLSSVNVELQQRAAEYLAIFKYDQLRPSLLERMPPPEQRETKQTLRQAESPVDVPVQQPSAVAPVMAVPAQTVSASPSNLLELDLMGGEVSAPSNRPAAAMSAANDLLSLFGGDGPASTTTPAAAVTPQSFDPLADLLGGGAPATMSTPSAPAAAPSSAGTFVGYEKNGIRLLFMPQRDPMNPQVINVTLTFVNGTSTVLQNFAVQIAVPKTLKLQVQPPSTTTLTPGGNGTQLVRIANPTNEQIRLRIKVLFSANGQNYEDIDQVSNFPQL